MRRAALSTMFACLTAATIEAQIPGSTESPSTGAASPPARQSMEFLLKVSADPAVLPLTAATVNALLHSHAVMGRTARELGIKNDAGLTVDLHPPYLPIAERPHTDALRPIMVGQLSVRVNEQAGIDAGKLTALLIRNLKRALTTETQSERARLQQDVDQARDTAAAAREAHNGLLARRHKTVADLGADEGALDRAASEMQAAQTERARIEMELAGRRARQKAIMEQLAGIAKEAEASVASDSIQGALRKVVELRRMEYQGIAKLHEAGTIAESDVRKAETEVALAEAELLRQRQQTLQQAGGEQLTQLKRMLTEVTIDMPELEARMELIAKRVQLLTHRLQVAQELSGALAAELRRAEQAVDAAEAAHREAIQRVKSIREPEVNIIGGDADVEPPAKQP